MGFIRRRHRDPDADPEREREREMYICDVVLCYVVLSAAGIVTQMITAPQGLNYTQEAAAAAGAPMERERERESMIYNSSCTIRYIILSHIMVHYGIL